MEEKGNDHWILIGRSKGKRPFGRHQHRWKNIKTDIKEIQCADVYEGTQKLWAVIVKYMSTTDHIFCICQILEKKWECKEAVHQLFVDFKKVSDSCKKYSHWVWYPHENGKANKNVSKWNL